MTMGAADAVRGASSPAEEMAYIVSNSDSSAIIAQDSHTLERLATALPSGSSHLHNGNGSASHAVRIPGLSSGHALDILAAIETLEFWEPQLH
jgi:long-subunit acyl-CoA synthetase (AMP-forming)